MMGFFPDPFPDELLYSVFARYSNRVKYQNKKSVIKEIFGNKKLVATVDLPTKLEIIFNALPKNNNYSVNEFIYKNTLFPFYEPFIPFERAQSVRKEMISASHNNISVRLGLRVRQIVSLRTLRFCPICVDSDRKQYGETFWHRLHQLSGVLVCPKHESFLENSSLSWGRESSASFQAAEDFITGIKSKFIDKNSNEDQVLLKIAKDAEWLLTQKNLSLDTGILRQRYYNLLLHKGLAYYNGNVKHNNLVKACQEYFSPELFIRIGQVSKRDKWLSILVESHKTEVVYHPIRHLLLITFLGLTSEQFFTSFVEFKPFGDPPYPCLNKAANHYGEMRIKRCDVFDNLSKDKKKQSRPIAYFKCDCGFIYQRVGPDESEKDKFNYSRVREYGETWERRLAELWSDLSLSGVEIAESLGIGDLTVRRQAIRLNLPMNTENTRSLQGYNRHRNPERSLSQFRHDQRNNWLIVIKNNPELTRRKLMYKEISLYLWLSRNDSEWFKQHLPEVTKITKNVEKLNWKKIDNDLSKKVAKICCEIYKIESFPVRVSITEVIRRIGYKTWIEKRERKLPLTNKVSSQSLESLEDYMIRKVAWAKSQFLDDKKIPTMLYFKMKASLRNKTSNESEKVQQAIKKCSQ